MSYRHFVSQKVRSTLEKYHNLCHRVLSNGSSRTGIDDPKFILPMSYQIIQLYTYKYLNDFGLTEINDLVMDHLLNKLIF